MLKESFQGRLVENVSKWVHGGSGQNSSGPGSDFVDRSERTISELEGMEKKCGGEHHIIELYRECISGR